MVFYDKPDSVCRFFPIGFVKINDKDICVAVFVENILTYDVPEPVVAAFEMGDNGGIVQLKECAAATFSAFNSVMVCFGANAWLLLICAGGCIADAPVFSAIPVSVHIFAAGKKIAKELEFVARWARAGNDALGLCTFAERFAGFVPFFECCVTDVWTVATDYDLLTRI